MCVSFRNFYAIENLPLVDGAYIIAEMYLEGVCRDFMLCILFWNLLLVDDVSIIAEMYLEGFAATVFCVFVFEFTIGRSNVS